MNISRVSLFNTALNFPKFGQKKENSCCCGFCTGSDDSDTFSRRSDDVISKNIPDKDIVEIIKKPTDDDEYSKLDEINPREINDIDKIISDPNLKEVQKKANSAAPDYTSKKLLEVGDWPPAPKEQEVGDWPPAPNEQEVGDWPPMPKEYEIGDVPIPPERKVGDVPIPPERQIGDVPIPPERKVGDWPIPEELKITCLDEEE